MQRCKEYSCFALSFAGLGYITLWLLTVPVLPPALNATGMLAAIFFVARMLLLAARHWRGDHDAAPALHAAAALPWASPPKSYRLPPPVKPRSHFGLRGTPH